jgi:hypothetical protein
MRAVDMHMVFTYREFSGRDDFKCFRRWSSCDVEVCSAKRPLTSIEFSCLAVVSL